MVFSYKSWLAFWDIETFTMYRTGKLSNLNPNPNPSTNPNPIWMIKKTIDV